MERQKNWPRIIGSVFLLFLLSVWVSAAQAATLTVNSLNNDGTGSLRQAIANAAAGDTIVFSSSLSGKTITLQSELVVNKNLTIISSVPVTISGNDTVRVFNIASGTVVLEGLTIIKGKATGTPVFGGGIYNNAMLTIKKCTISRNAANSAPSNSGMGGGIYNSSSGQLFAENSTFSSNASDYGGGIFNRGRLTVRHCTFSTNITNWGGGIYNETSNSTCDGTPMASISKSTFSGNTALAGGGIRNYNGLIEIVRSTITSNTSGGVWSYNGSASCTRIGSSIIAGNSGNDVAANMATTRYYSLNYNLIGTAGSNVDFTQEFNQANDQRGVTNPKLNALANNGGTTLTHALQLGSPAIDKADVCANDPDQRGVFRPQGSTCDIGAYEYEYQAAAAGELHTLAAKSDGSLWAWGGNSSGQLGNGDIDKKNRLIPIPISTPSKYQAIAAGTGHSAAIKMNRTLWTWGDNSKGQLGISSKDAYRLTTTQVGTEANWKTVAAGWYHTVAIKNDGTLWAWGDNSKGQLGNGDQYGTAQPSPVRIGTEANWKSVAAGNYHTIAIKTNGTLWAWGSTTYGQLGNGVQTKNAPQSQPQRTPVQIGTATNWKAVVAGSAHTVAIKNDGTLWVWGDNSSGQLGFPASETPQSTPVQLGTATWKTAAAGALHTLAIKTDGTLWAWGNNSAGQLGRPRPTPPETPQLPAQIDTATNWQSVAAGWHHSIGIKADRTLWTWGNNSNGQLGDNTEYNYRATPKQISW